MELQATGNQEIAQKEMVSKFVHDVADMEVRKFTLQEIVNKCRKDMPATEKNLSNRYEKVLKEIESCRQNLAMTQSRMNNQHEWHPDTFIEYCRDVDSNKSKKRLIGYGFLHFSVFVTIVSVLSVFETVFSSKELSFLQLGSFICYVMVYLGIWYLVRHHKYKKEREKQIKKYLQEKERWPEVIISLNEQMTKKEKEQKEITALLDYIREGDCRKTIEQIDATLAQINQNLQTCYSLNIIKPAYRNLISVVILDEIFANDKADTMREAMLLCDTEIRHAELIGKLDQVVHALKTLSATMISISSILNGINTNISLISQDVYKLSENQGRIAYATESLQKSADNTDFYIAQKRAGAL